MSGSEAAPGTCPAPACRPPRRTVNTRRPARNALHFMSRLLGSVGGLARFQLGPLHRWLLRWRRSRRRHRLTDSEAHHRDLLLLGHNDLLSQPLDLRVATMAK